MDPLFTMFYEGLPFPKPSNSDDLRSQKLSKKRWKQRSLQNPHTALPFCVFLDQGQKNIKNGGQMGLLFGPEITPNLKKSPPGPPGGPRTPPNAPKPPFLLTLGTTMLFNQALNATTPLNKAAVLDPYQIIHNRRGRHGGGYSACALGIYIYIYMHDKYIYIYIYI